MTDHYFWEAITILIPIVIGVPISAYISLRIQRKMKKEDTDGIISNMKEAIKQEIEEHIDAIGKEDMTPTEGGGVKSTNVKYLEISSFESSVKSGNFILLNSELRKIISELYTLIHLTNFQVDQLIKSQFTLTTDETKEKFESILALQSKGMTDKHDKVVKLSKELIKKL